MTEKEFRVQEHCLRSSYGIEAENWLVTNDNHSVVLNDKAEAHMVANMSNDVIDKLNALHEENKQLKKAEMLANHRGEMIGFANALIDDLGGETMREMWDKFKNGKYEKWCELE